MVHDQIIKEVISSSDDSTLDRAGEIIPNIDLPTHPIHSANMAQLNVTPDSVEPPVSEQLANIENRKGNASDSSQNVTQQQYEHSDKARVSRDRRVMKKKSGVSSRSPESNNLIELFNRNEQILEQQ